MKRLRILLILFAAGLVACTGAAVPPATTAACAGVTDGAAEPVIVLTRSGGIDGGLEQWMIYADGRVVHTPTAGQEPVTVTVAPDRVCTLVSNLETLGFFQLADAYGTADTCADCFQYELTVRSGAQTKTVTTTEPASDAPEALGQILQLVMGLAGG